MHVLPSVRLYVNHPMSMGGVISLEKDRANYVFSVLQLNDGDLVAVFNGVDGEWVASICKKSEMSADLHLDRLLRPQPVPRDLHYIFAPLKRDRFDYMVQKAVELGVSRLTPVITQHTNVDRVNLDRMQVNAIEAAEQCGILQLPLIDKPVKLTHLINEWDESRGLVFCDERQEVGGPIADLKGFEGQSVAVLIGPEGGFSADERHLLREKRFVKAISLGPRILRADTAAVAALSLVNAVIGDWQSS